jgi:DNA-binding HxlR family transcriptional regulator
MRCRSCKPVPEEVRRVAVLLERRWVVSVLWASYEGATRFNEFKQALGSIPPGTLAQRLVELEEAGVLERRVIDARPPRVEVPADGRGRRLKHVVDAVSVFAAADRRHSSRQDVSVLALTRPGPTCPSVNATAGDSPRPFG